MRQRISVLSILTIMMLAFCQSGFAQKHYELTLEESIDIAKRQSYSMLKLIEDTEIAAQNMKATIARYRTHIDLTFTLPRYTETVRQNDESSGISFTPIKQLRNNIGLSISQPLPTDGSVFIETGLNHLDDYNVDNRYIDFKTRIGLRQSLHSLWGYNSYRSSIRQAKLAYEQAQKLLKREELNLVYFVSSAYYNFLSLQKSEQIALLNLERQSEAYEISKNKYESGLIREVDALQMEVDLAEAQSNYDIALLNHASAGNSFKELIGIDLIDKVTLNSRLDYAIVAVDPEFAVELAMKNRLEIREQEISIERQQINLKQSKASRQPSVNIDAYYERSGISAEKFSAGVPTSVQNTFRDFTKRPSNFGVGLTVSIPIFNWGENRANVRAAEARLRQYEFSKIETERSIETEVRNLTANLSSTLKRLQLLEKNVVVAEKSFDITLKRYSDGDIDSQALALERTRLNTAYTSHLTAYINYQLVLADLMRKTFYDFRNDRAIE